ncbi:MAG: hypothetical protein CL910_10800 [Deltaproteobacteria bacterium]|nr:hypothetical protein [Deltaproteobacteria bacterium]
MPGPTGEPGPVLLGGGVLGSAPLGDGDAGHQQGGAGQVGHREALTHQVAACPGLLRHEVEGLARRLPGGRRALRVDSHRALHEGAEERDRARIVDRATALFRKEGYRGVGIDRIMAAADLTRGGFYAHFPSKAALFAEVLGRESDFVRRLRATPDAREVIAGYLDPSNREKVARGCTLATLTNEVPRRASRLRPPRRSSGRGDRGPPPRRSSRSQGARPPGRGPVRRRDRPGSRDRR